MQVGRTDEAMALYNSVIENSNDGTTLWRRAQLCIQIGNKEQAAADIARAAPSLSESEVDAAFKAVIQLKFGERRSEPVAEAQEATPSEQRSAAAADGKKRQRVSE